MESGETTARNVVLYSVSTASRNVNVGNVVVLRSVNMESGKLVAESVVVLHSVSMTN
jgi:hypothetical protein